MSEAPIEPRPAVLAEPVKADVDDKIVFAPQVTYTQYQLSLQSKWDSDTVRCTLEEHENGIFHRSAQLAEFCRRNDRIYAALRTRVMGALGLPFSVEKPGDCDNDPRLDKVCKLADKAMQRIPESTLAKILRGVVMLGFCLAQIHWDYEDGYFWPRLEPWDAQWVYYDHNEKCYRVQTKEGILRVNPGDGKWALFMSGSEEDSWLDGAIRPLGLLYLLGQISWVDWANYNETHGQPIKLVKVPAGAKGSVAAGGSPDPQEQKNQLFFKQVMSMKKAGGVLLPQHKEGNVELNYALELLEAKDGSWETFNTFKTTINIAIALILLGQHLTSETGETGTQALGRIHENVRQDLMEGDTDMLSEHLRTQVFCPWAEYNFGDRNLAPYPIWDATPPPDAKLELEGVKLLLEAASAAKQLGAPVDLPLDFRAIAKKYGLPLLAQPMATPMAPPIPGLPPISKGPETPGYDAVDP